VEGKRVGPRAFLGFSGLHPGEAYIFEQQERPQGPLSAGDETKARRKESRTEARSRGKGQVYRIKTQDERSKNGGGGGRKQDLDGQKGECQSIGAKEKRGGRRCQEGEKREKGSKSEKMRKWPGRAETAIEGEEKRSARKAARKGNGSWASRALLFGRERDGTLLGYPVSRDGARVRPPGSPILRPGETTM